MGPKKKLKFNQPSRNIIEEAWAQASDSEESTPPQKKTSSAETPLTSAANRTLPFDIEKIIAETFTPAKILASFKSLSSVKTGPSQQNKQQQPTTEEPNELIEFLILTDMTKIDPFQIEGSLSKYLNRKPVITGKGKKIQVLVSRTENEKMKNIQEIAGYQVRVLNKPLIKKIKMIITGVPLEISIDIITKNSGCSAAVRIKKKIDGRFQETTAVILTYEPDQNPPNYVKISFLNFRVKEYLPNPVRCFNCNQFGHVAKYCKAKTSCPRCAGEHELKNCSTPQLEPSKKICASCQSPDHRTGSEECPKWQKAKRTIEIATSRKTYSEALKSGFKKTTEAEIKDKTPEIQKQITRIAEKTDVLKKKSTGKTPEADTVAKLLTMIDQILQVLSTLVNQKDEHHNQEIAASKTAAAILPGSGIEESAGEWQQ